MTTLPSPSSRSRDPWDPYVGKTINGKFEVVSRLAAGGMGRIYKARQIALDRTVALKVLHPQFTQDTVEDSFQKRFSQEASILARLQHGNIVTVYDYGKIEPSYPDTYFMVMEYLPGQTLQDRMVDLGHLLPAEVFGIVRQVARGLREAHKQGIVHRDLKPSNIMLIPQDGGTETVKILDFGLVKVLSDDADQFTKEGSFLGSPRYMSPEHITHGEVDARTDIYALGVIMYHALCGALPFDSPQAMQTLVAHVSRPVPPMRAVAPTVQVPEIVENLVRRCLAKKPDERPSSVHELMRGIMDCERALGLAPSLMYAGENESDSFSRSRSRNMNMSSAPPDLATIVYQPKIHDITVVSPSVRRRWPVLVAAGVGVAALIAVTAGVVVTFRSSATASASSAPSPSARSEGGTFVLSIESTPAGAEVFERGARLGLAPMQMTLDREALRASPRTFELRLQGHRPYTIVQGPSSEAVRVNAMLSVLAPAPDAASANGVTDPPARTWTRSVERHRPNPEKTAEPPPRSTDSDIRMRR